MKLQVDSKVLDALKAAFPRPERSAKRALDKYVSQLEAMLIASFHRNQSIAQRRLGLFDLSLHELANRGGQIGPNKQRLHAWLSANGLALIEVVTRGDKFSKAVSQVKLTPLAKLVTSSAASAQTAGAHQVLGTAAGARAPTGKMTFQAPAQWTIGDLAPHVVKRGYDLVPIDLSSLRAYIAWLGGGSVKMPASARETAAVQAKWILNKASANNGIYRQRQKKSPFGRTYYEGVSVQNVNKELRRAMLGDCVEYDINCSVVAWKLGFAQEFLSAHQSTQSVRQAFKSSVCYVEDKRDFLVTIARYVFTGEEELSGEFCLGLVKQAITALGFGARLTSQGWRDSSGEWTNPALVNILKKKAWRTIFFNHWLVQQFVAEQNALDHYLFECVKTHFPFVLQRPHVQTASGRPSRAKVLALLYQTGETQVMNIVRRATAEMGFEPLACVHDAIFFRHALGVDRKLVVEQAMRTETDNPFWRLNAKVLVGYRPVGLIDEDDSEVQAHRQRIRDEEAHARIYREKRKGLS